MSFAPALTAPGRPAGHRGVPRADLASEPVAPYTAAPPTGPAAVGGGAGTCPSDEVGAQVDQLAEALTDPIRLAALDADGLRARVDLAQRLQGLATTVLTTAVRALAETGGTEQDGAPSTSAWVRDRLGQSGREAARTARLATTLPELPATAAALADGSIGVETADVVVQAARDGRLGPPEQVDAQLAPLAAQSSPEQLRRSVRTRQQQADAAAMVRDERRQHQRRKVSLTRRDDGMWNLHGLLPAEVGDKARTLLDTFDVPDPDGTDPEHRRRPDQRLADAFATAVDVALDHADLPSDGGVARPHLSVIVDLATLHADLADPDDPDRPVAPDDPAWASLPAGDTAWGGQLSPQAVRRLCCDANVSRVVTSGPSQVLDVGRATRNWTAPQRRAIAVRDRTCRGPSCNRPIGWTQIHHIQWWRNDGETNLDNGIALCHHCHRLVHDHGWEVQFDPATSAATWTSPDRRRTVVTHPRPPG